MLWPAALKSLELSATNSAKTVRRSVFKPTIGIMAAPSCVGSVCNRPPHNHHSNTAIDTYKAFTTPRALKKRPYANSWIDLWLSRKNRVLPFNDPKKVEAHFNKLKVLQPK